MLEKCLRNADFSAGSADACGMLNSMQEQVLASLSLRDSIQIIASVFNARDLLLIQFCLFEGPSGDRQKQRA